MTIREAISTLGGAGHNEYDPDKFVKELREGAAQGELYTTEYYVEDEVILTLVEAALRVESLEHEIEELKDDLYHERHRT